MRGLKSSRGHTLVTISFPSYNSFEKGSDISTLSVDLLEAIRLLSLNDSTADMPSSSTTSKMNGGASKMA